MTPKTVLVLAASVYQLDAIRTARRLGYRIVTVDNRPGNPGHALADASFDVDTTDLPGVLEVARKEQIDGIISPCTDVAVPAAAFVASELGLPGVPFESTLISSSKVRFREFLTSHGFACPTAFPIDANFSPPNGIFERRWVIKPNRSSGSKGVRIVDSAESFAASVTGCLSYDPDASGVMEEYFEGHQGTCEGFVQDGRISFSLLLDRETAAHPFVATHGHRVPTVLSTGDVRRVVDTITAVMRGLGFNDGPFDCDFIVRPEDVVVLEIGPRLGGNSIAPLVRLSTGFDLTEAAIRAACAEPVEFPSTTFVQPAGLALLGVMSAGALTFNAAEVDRLRSMPWVHHLDIDVEEGSPVEPFIDGRKRIGEALVTGVNREDVDARVNEVRRAIDLRSETINV